MQSRSLARLRRSGAKQRRQRVELLPSGKGFLSLTQCFNYSNLLVVRYISTCRSTYGERFSNTRSARYMCVQQI